MRIERAWCVELGRDVDIQQAHQAYFEQPKPRQRFKFLCTDPDCRQAGVKISGVAYDRQAIDGDKLKTPHFRFLNLHMPGCNRVAPAYWRPPSTPTETQQGSSHAPKQTDLVDVFDVGIGSGKVRHPHISNTQPEPENQTEVRGGISPDKGLTTTDRLSAVVSVFLGMSYQERLRTMIRVKPIGDLAYAAFFVPVANIALDTKYCAIHGGCKIDKQYRDGSVRLVFFDRINARKTVVYLSSDVTDEPGHGAFRRDVIERMASGAGYAHAYVFGQPRFDEPRGQIELIYSDPRHVDLRFKEKPLKQA